MTQSAYKVCRNYPGPGWNKGRAGFDERMYSGMTFPRQTQAYEHQTRFPADGGGMS